MSSRRLPGKPLMNVAGKKLLQRIIENLQRVEPRAEIVVATSVDERDGALADWCAAHGHECFRGPLDDVAERVIRAGKYKGADAIVRVSGDSPLIDPALVSLALRLYCQGEVDLVTNVQQRTFPKGCSVEVIRIAALERQLRAFASGEDREHVTTVFYREPASVRIVNFTSGMAAGDIQLSIDTIDDFHSIERILTATRGAGAEPMGWRRAVELHAQLMSTPAS
jgi:spore coat polysaccharide biosynthesis protein SpsF (cytidylyltransferase family)